MLSTSFLPSVALLLSKQPLEGVAAAGAGPQSALTKQLQASLHKGAAQALTVAAAGATCDLSVTECSALETSALACSPPRTHIVNNFSRLMTVPTSALAATRPRRKRSGGGGDEDAGGGDGGGFGGSGDDGWGPWGDEGEGGDGGDAFGGFARDVVLLWSVFCAVSFATTLQHVTRAPPKRAIDALA